jgi:hypothetical protein
MDSRRDVLRKLAISATAVGVASTAQAGTLPADSPLAAAAQAQGTAAPAKAVQPAPQPPLALVAPHQPGDSLAAGWTLGYVKPVEHGAVVLGIASLEGPVARVHICRNDGQPRGIAHTGRFDLVLMNGGDGGTPSQEQLGRVLLGLANVVAANEAAALAAHPELGELLTHDQRVQRFGQEDSEILS